MRQFHASSFTYLANLLVQCTCACCVLTQPARAEPASPNAGPGQVLLNGSLGQLNKVPSNAVPANLLPPPGIGLEYQVPQPGCVLQLTPFARLQPDLKVVWNPAYNPKASHTLVFQLQLNMAW